MVHARFDTAPTSGSGRIRVKVEINISETDAFQSRIEVPYAVDSAWWRGEARVVTFSLEELLGTKLRALYQSFRDDMLQLVTDLPEEYEPDPAANEVMEKLGSGLRNAPSRDEIQGGAWRR